MSKGIACVSLAFFCALSAAAAEPPVHPQSDLKYLSWRATRADVVMEYCKDVAPRMQRELSTAQQHIRSELVKADQQLKEARKAYSFEVVAKTFFTSDGPPFVAGNSPDPVAFCATFSDELQGARADAFVAEEMRSWNQWLDALPDLPGAGAE